MDENTEEDNREIWQNFLTQCGAKLTSPGLSVRSGVLVLVLVRVLVQAHVQVLWNLLLSERAFRGALLRSTSSFCVV